MNYPVIVDELTGDQLLYVIDSFASYKTPKECYMSFRDIFKCEAPLKKIKDIYSLDIYKPDREIARKKYNERRHSIPIANEVCRLEDINDIYQTIKTKLNELLTRRVDTPKQEKALRIEISETWKMWVNTIEQARKETAVQLTNIVKGDMTVINQQFNSLFNLPAGYLERIEKGEISLEEAEKEFNNRMNGIGR